MLGTVLQRDQRRGLYKTDKLPQIQLRPEPLPDLGPWLELTLVRPPTDEPAQVRSTLRKLGLSTRQSVSFQRDIGPIRGMLCSVPACASDICTPPCATAVVLTLHFSLCLDRSTT